MNIVEYRAMKAQEEAEKQAQTEGVTSNAQTVTTTTEPQGKVETATTETNQTQPNEGTEGQTQTPSSEPKTITIEGLGEVDVDELKNGYLRQSDYTKKTQQLAEQSRQLEKVAKLYDAVQSNPERAQQLAQEFNVPHLDPQVDYVTELQNKYHDLLLEKEIGELKGKYPDFDPQKVLPLALEEKMDNLENAYLLHKARNPEAIKSEAPVDVNAIKEQIRQDLLKELELERNTQSIITSGNGAPVTDNQPVLSDAELRVARNMGLSPQDYAKWKS